MAVSCPDCARHATRSRPKYFIRCTSPTLISSDQATWNQPVGVIDRGGLAMSRNHTAFNVNLEPPAQLPPKRNSSTKSSSRWVLEFRFAGEVGVSIPVQVG